MTRPIAGRSRHRGRHDRPERARHEANVPAHRRPAPAGAREHRAVRARAAARVAARGDRRPLGRPGPGPQPQWAARGDPQPARHRRDQRAGGAPDERRRPLPGRGQRRRLAHDQRDRRQPGVDAAHGRAFLAVHRPRRAAVRSHRSHAQHARRRQRPLEQLQQPRRSPHRHAAHDGRREHVDRAGRRGRPQRNRRRRARRSAPDVRPTTSTA